MGTRVQNSSTENKADVSRRQFLKHSSVATGGAVTGVLAADQMASAQAVHSGANDMLKVGIVGCGLRGTGALDKFLGLPGKQVKVVAMGDAFEASIGRSYRQLERRYADRLDVPAERRFVGLDAYKHVLESDCDVVILTTPPGFRPFHFEQAIKAGKNVFMEKPVAVDATGVRRVLATGKLASEKGLAVGVGLQRRHDPKYQESIQRIHDGQIGDVLLSRVYWNSGGVWVRTRADLAKSLGREPSELEYQVNNWYYFNWLCGDHIAEQHIHNLDVSNWAKQMLPISANGQGGREIRTSKETGQIFDHHVVEYTYPDGTTMMSQCRHQRGCWSEVGEYFAGTKGTAEFGLRKDCAVSVGDDKFAYAGPEVDPSVKTIADLVDSIRANKPYNESEYGATSSMTSILGRMATYSGKVVTWDEAINSEIEVGPRDLASWDTAPPVRPNADGYYPVPVPGKTKVV